MATNGSIPSSTEPLTKPAQSGPGQLDGPGNRMGPIMVQPPRREDLQPSYAQTLQGESDSSSHGWYGGMSEYTRLRRYYLYVLTTDSQPPRILYWKLRSRPLLHLLPQPIQASFARKCRPGHQVWTILPRRRSWTRQDQPTF